ncbi:MAG: IPT/TIG domain-containing protein [Streptosporangiaceae bacterium]
MVDWRRTLFGPGSAPGSGGATGQIARRGRWCLSIALLTAAAGLAGASADAAAAAPADRAAPAGHVATVPAEAAGSITFYSSPKIFLSRSGDSDNSITAGPDGALWFTNPRNRSIGRITTYGYVTDYRGHGIGNPWVITTGPDGALWAGNWNTHSISRITTAGKITTFFRTANTPVGIAASSHYLWYTNWAIPSSIGRMTTRGKATSFGRGSDVSYPGGITEGSDGAMWFINGYGPRPIGRITQSGRLTFYPYPLPYVYLGSITAGPDGDLWITYPQNNGIGRITTKGVVTSFISPHIVRPAAIAAGPDGALWFTESNAIGRITTTGQLTSYPVPDLGNRGDITAGPDGAMWFTDSGTNRIGRIATSVTPWITGKTPTSGPPGTRVTITGLNLSPATRVSFHGTPATIVSDTATSVVAIVPPGATTGRIMVTTPVGIAAGNTWFRVT